MIYRRNIMWITTSLLILSYGCSLSFSSSVFNPRLYSKKYATREAIKRAPQEEFVNISLSYVEINPQASNTILMVHGWPSMWSTWANQIQEFKANYHLIVPDLRGFGESTHPGDVKSSGTMGDIIGDLVFILQHAQVNSAVCMGHDWGSQVCYEAARMRPDIFTAVVGVVVPYMPSAGPFVPIKELTPVFPKLTYQVYFDTKTDTAISELNKDIRQSIRAVLRTVDSPPPDNFLTSSDSFLGAWNSIETIPPIPFFSPDEEDYMVEKFSIQGFNYTLQFYTQENRYASWSLAQIQGNYSIPQPVLAIYPLHDPVADFKAASVLLKSQDFTPTVTVEVLEGAHWAHLEHPQQFNDIVRKWLEALPRSGLTDPTEAVRIADEL